MSNSTFLNRATFNISFLSLFSFSILAFASPSQAVSLGSFEGTTPFIDWEVSGDVSQQGTFPGIPPTDGISQALLTTASTTVGDDLPDAVPGTFNFSGNDPTLAGTNPVLESFLGLDVGALDLNSPSVQAIEGSAIKRTFTAQAGDILSFDWQFLTNDGEFLDFGPRDQAFVALYPVGSPSAPVTIATSIDVLPASGTDFAHEVGDRFTSTPLDAGDYFLGLGVVDGLGTDKTSALLVDNVLLTSPPSPSKIPEPTSVIGLLLWGAFKIGSVVKGSEEE